MGPDNAPGEGRFSHIDESGKARMVDVGDKSVSDRRAKAFALVKMSVATAEAVEKGDAPKGDVLGTARLAGVQAAKRVDELIPLTHSLPLSYVNVDTEVNASKGTVEITSEAHASYKTGVEMEALTAAAVAALTVYDMTKALEQGVVIERVELLEKTGGKSDWRRPS